MAPDGYHITTNSAALNAGITTTNSTPLVDDIDGGPCPRQGAYDLDADELGFKVMLPAARK